MEFIQLNEEEFKVFALNHPLKTFLQTVEIAKLREISGWTSYYVGVKENKKLVAATMMLSKKRKLGYYEFYAPRGFLIDYQNKELLEFFTKKLVEFIKQKRGYILRIEPYVMDVERDINGDLVKDGINNMDIINNLINLGYKKASCEEQCKLMFVLDTKDKTEEDILTNMRPSTRRNIISKCEKYNIELKELKYDELDVFKKVADSTGERKHFLNKPITYYEKMYRLFDDHIKYIMASINLSNYIEILNKEIEEETTKLEDIMSNIARRGNHQENIDNLNKKIISAKELIKEKGNTLYLSGAMFITYGDEVVYLVSGNYKEYMNFNAQYKIQWEMIKYAINNKYKLYNFYGIKEYKDKKNINYGIYEFKKGFNGRVVELIGEFQYPINKIVYQITTLISKIKGLKK